ncbi:MarR family winged helix-turn-helix transcriptional regulator [Streptomyces sp. HF10]|uniref:MarR family winged helix-turn-helix transcriptional regulator n=1 Tax=Streptomyces sp. HF10 TaxID=2692233 RepID=UPI0013169A15|nr:MarR family transcriptional regulator [Streptomyces sp. HF10]QHC31317.1 MarR family transcriptional regulator [Streptomyces sp. HF10]
MSGADPALDVIERQTAVLMRNFELLHRRTDVHDRLDRAQYLLLRTLSDGGPMTITTLACTLGLDPSTAGRQVAALTAAGLVERAADPADRRRWVITPTAEGLREMRVVRDRRTESHADLLGDWDPEDLRTLGTMLDRYNRAVAARYLLTPPAETPTETPTEAPAGAPTGTAARTETTAPAETPATAAAPSR